MEKNIFILSEFLDKVKAGKDELLEWEALGLVHPVGFSEEKGALYDNGAIEKVHKIQKLLELGYATQDIQKIIRKVGLPKTEIKKPKSKKGNQYLTVGSLAEQVGVSPRAIKHWEDKGIIGPDMRSEAGFRLYSDVYVEVCKRVRDLQLLGFTLEEIKDISDDFRKFLDLHDHFRHMKTEDASRMLEPLSEKLNTLFEKMQMLRQGIQRWEGLLRKTKKEITNMKQQIKKRFEKKEGDKHA